MSAEVPDVYATRYGFTKEVAVTAAATLEEQGLEVEVKAARDVRSLDGFGAVLLGTPLHMGALHKDVRTHVERHQVALEQTPLALFALGPISAEEGVEGSRKQVDAALAKLPWLSPVATEVFVGAFDPAKLGFKDKMIAVLPASSLHGELAQDERDWEAIRAWAREAGQQIMNAPAQPLAIESAEQSKRQASGPASIGAASCPAE